MKITLIFLMASISSVNFLNQYQNQMIPQMGDVASFGNFGMSPLIAHVNETGTPHSGGPNHDFMHGRRGSGTWPDGTSKTDPRFNQGGRTFADGTPLTSKNYEAFKINPNVAPIMQ